ncbi:MAG TPA: DUF1801 domain-containing protein [Anaerolineales bacterium]|jgi:hypothetical protein
MKITTVGQFLEQRVQPQNRKIVDFLRKFMREAAPDTKEVVTYGILAWRRKLIVAVVSPTKKDITFSFSRGAEFEDKYGLLEGVGKVSKFVKIKNLKEVNKPALKYYVKQALNLDDQRTRK